LKSKSGIGGESVSSLFLIGTLIGLVIDKDLKNPRSGSGPILALTFESFAGYLGSLAGYLGSLA